MNTLKSLILTWFCLNSADPDHLNEKEKCFHLAGSIILVLTGVLFLFLGLSIVDVLC
jgi:hypothetical protein